MFLLQIINFKAPSIRSQDFVRLVYASGDSGKPSFCRVSVAPLDVLSCQHTMLKVTAFVAKALPPPELNPVHLKVHVSLREVLQDSLRGLHQQVPAAAGVPSYEVCLSHVQQQHIDDS